MISNEPNNPAAAVGIQFRRLAGIEEQDQRLPGRDRGNAGSSQPSLPNPRLLRKLIRLREKRRRYFEGDYCAGPAWDMLLDLAAARMESTQVSVTSLCIASRVPQTTALRWIADLIEAGLFERTEDTQDRRRTFIAITDKAANAMARYFADVRQELEQSPCCCHEQP